MNSCFHRNIEVPKVNCRIGFATSHFQMWILSYRVKERQTRTNNCVIRLFLCVIFKQFLEELRDQCYDLFFITSEQCPVCVLIKGTFHSEIPMVKIMSKCLFFSVSPFHCKLYYRIDFWWCVQFEECLLCFQSIMQ